MLRFLAALLLILFGASPALSCSCFAGFEETRVASLEAETHQAVIAVATKQYLTGDERGVGVLTEFEILDDLNSGLTGTVLFSDPAAFTSCASSYLVGGLANISVDQSETIQESFSCGGPAIDLISEFQVTGIDRTVPPRRECVKRDEENFHREIYDPSPRCEYYRNIGNEPEWASERLEDAKRVYLNRYGVEYDLNFDFPEYEFGEYAHVSELMDDFYIFSGMLIQTALLETGSNTSTYAVLDDFDQFLPETLTFENQNNALGYRSSELVLVSKRSGEIVHQYNVDDDLVLGFADWLSGGRDWELPIESCYSDCNADQMNYFALQEQIIYDRQPDSALLKALEIAERTLID